jgi:hypothetical protein
MWLSMSGLWMCWKSHCLMIKRWRFGFNLNIEYFSFRHIWVLLPNLPLQLWNHSALIWVDIMVVPQMKCGRYLPPRVNLTRIEYSGKKEETLMSWLITLEDMSAQEDNLY